ncbi:Myb/SANT-like DNA-binding domain-containing protein 4 [Acipenser ruthenus]|uniref:Myb/SANT-like DNA-binding domain-containing protein 4 n=1 Tax=Acipenser ruthenus TaxID=7906 RepID=A0A444UZV3_ACIRT|nr:Myb/SANT-like DNA-binding domain-containing protein 4 [Acipenser ruthenus]
MKQLKRKRKSNYSVKETQTLIREIRKRKDVLFSKQQNTAINELKRRAWDEVADCVNALGEGELRTAVEVKRRYLDWRALMKRKQVRAELSQVKNEYNLSSPDIYNSVSSDQSVDLSGFSKDLSCEWQDLSEFGEPNSQPSSSVKIEDDDPQNYKLEGGEEEEEGEGEGEEGEGDEEEDEDSFPTILPGIEREGRVPEVFAHIDEFGMLSATKAATRDAADADDGTNILITLEKQRLDLEKHRLNVESERLQVEKERLQIEKEKLRRIDIEHERLQLEKERLQIERERLRLLMFQSERPALDCEHSQTERKPWQPVDLEGEKLKLEKERLQLEKERLQFFKFESGRLQIEKERLQVEKERLQLHKDGQQLALHQSR